MTSLLWACMHPLQSIDRFVLCQRKEGQGEGGQEEWQQGEVEGGSMKAGGTQELLTAAM